MERLELPPEAEDERCSAALQEVEHWLTEGRLYKGDLEIVHDEVAFIRSVGAAPRGIPGDLSSRVDSVLRPAITPPCVAGVGGDPTNRFVPPPRRSEESWREGEIANLLYPEGCCDEAESSEWVIDALHTSEWDAPPQGYPIFFPTATDCLLWIRWQVLPTIELGTADALWARGAGIELRGKVGELAQWIDDLRPGTRTETALPRALADLRDGSLLEEKYEEQRGEFDFEIVSSLSTGTWLLCREEEEDDDG